MTMKNKKLLIAASVVSLLPMVAGLLLWERLPDQLPTHFGIDGAADGWSGKAFAVFGIPLMMLAFQWICYGATLLDKQNRGHNRKVLDLTILIFPCISLFFSLFAYTTALGIDLTPTHFLFPLLGLFFILLGNWLPKIKQNATLGIKLPWTLYNEENWNRTHRFGGWCWVIGGIVFCTLGFLPEKALLWALPGNLILLALLPTLYSWNLAKKQKAEGRYTQSEVNKTYKQHPVITAVCLTLAIVLLAGVGVLMFIGDIEYTFTDTALTIDADFWDDSTVPYDQIDSAELLDTVPAGTRDWGYASAKLLLGLFSGEELGSHIRYTYAGTDNCILLTCGEKLLLLSADTEAATGALYESICARIGVVQP